MLAGSAELTLMINSMTDVTARFLSHPRKALVGILCDIRKDWKRNHGTSTNLETILFNYENIQR